jgi:hypothetical protein
MQHCFRRLIAFTAVFLSVSSVAFSDDFLSSGGSARAAATAGAYLPSSDDVLDAMAINPAGLALLGAPVLDLSVKAVFARGQFTDSANPNGRLDSNGAIPYGAFGGPLGSGRLGRHLSFGVAVLPELLGDSRWRYTDPPGGVGGVSYGSLNSNSEILAVRAAAGIGVYLGAYSHRRMSLKVGRGLGGSRGSFLVIFESFGADQREAS